MSRPSVAGAPPTAIWRATSDDSLRDEFFFPTPSKGSHSMKANRSNTEWKVSLSQPSTTTLCWLERARVTDDDAGSLIAAMQDDFAKDPAHFPPLFRNSRQMKNYLCAEFDGFDEAPIPETHLRAASLVWGRYAAWVNRHPHCIREREALKRNCDCFDALVRAWHECREYEQSLFRNMMGPQIRVRAELAAKREARVHEIARAANEEWRRQYAHRGRLESMPEGPEELAA